jgi:hypothetical protein
VYRPKACDFSEAVDIAPINRPELPPADAGESPVYQVTAGTINAVFERQPACACAARP